MVAVSVIGEPHPDIQIHTCSPCTIALDFNNVANLSFGTLCAAAFLGCGISIDELAVAIEHRIRSNLAMSYMQ